MARAIDTTAPIATNGEGEILLPAPVGVLLAGVLEGANLPVEVGYDSVSA